ncbi:Binding-protein-dependent transport system inner membrane component [Marininema mesophilum]|uniref:Binding-protein-dependent transport system inner membrane component n=1 Tax=Marininema mesophilum TaxID=1048340 RepID=A0A1H2Z0J4_9BACL|nr:ABC transporter permease subunit [Marininema mesophilum]SDX10866.1 Binding-protein-dependent transport system inner membrane component [Marininema mesophilum]
MGVIVARAPGWLKDTVGFMSVFSDFTIALLLQLLIVWLYTQTQILFAETASVNGEEALLLPAISIIWVPLMYVIRTVSLQVTQVLSEDYILLAKAKGLTKKEIYSNHVVRNVLPFLRADLGKIASIMLGNLMVIEYLFRSPGFTYFLANSGNRDYSILANTLFGFLLLYLVTYLILHLLNYVLKRRYAVD